MSSVSRWGRLRPGVRWRARKSIIDEEVPTYKHTHIFSDLDENLKNGQICCPCLAGKT